MDRLSDVPGFRLLRHTSRIVAPSALSLDLIHRSAWRGILRSSQRLGGSLGSWLPQESSSRIHRRSPEFWWGGSLPSEQLLLPSRVARWFLRGHPFLLSLFTRVSRSEIPQSSHGSGPLQMSLAGSGTLPGGPYPASPAVESTSGRGYAPS
jgi:hypothetical protein